MNLCNILTPHLYFNSTTVCLLCIWLFQESAAAVVFEVLVPPAVYRLPAPQELQSVCFCRQIKLGVSSAVRSLPAGCWAAQQDEEGTQSCSTDQSQDRIHMAETGLWRSFGLFWRNDRWWSMQPVGGAGSTSHCDWCLSEELKWRLEEGGGRWGEDRNWILLD